MHDSIPDVILRLARRHMPIDAAAPVSPAPQEHEIPDPPVDPLASLPRETPDEAVDERVPAHNVNARPEADLPEHQHVVSTQTPQGAVSDLLHPDVAPIPNERQLDVSPSAGRSALPAAAAGNGSHPKTTSKPPLPASTTPDSGESAFAPANGESSSGVDQEFEQPDFTQFGGITPSFPGRVDRPHAIDNLQDDAFEPLDRSATTNGSSQKQSPVEAVSESSRQLEQTARDLETSLTHLFTTQIETLQRLRDRVDEHERRWVEQQSARRATL